MDQEVDEERPSASHCKYVIRQMKCVIVDMEYHLLQCILKKEFDTAYTEAIKVQEAYEWIEYFTIMKEEIERGEE